ncbi:MAG: hypothetical protein H7X84_01130 [Verrucomicrobia bacterium]|nr:hypothetical protein [Prolixibacteraceae bacterium]
MGLNSRIARQILDSKLSSVARDKRVYNLDTATSAGVLWTIDQKESFEKVDEQLRKAGIKTTGLCYSPHGKSLIPQEINGFSKKQINYWTEIPKSELVEDFIHQKFDLLIDLTMQKYFPLVYVTALSEANFKIGTAGSSQNYFDLNIDFQTSPDTAQLADQILYYLIRINKTTIE